jgi:hypothetical protein
MKTAQFVAAAVTAALLGTAGVSIAGAASSGSKPPASVTPLSPAAPERVNQTGLRRAARRAVKIAADTIGISPAELIQQLRAGKSIADVASEHNVNPQTVVNALVTKVEANLENRFTKLVNRHFGAHIGG